MGNKHQWNLHENAYTYNETWENLIYTMSTMLFRPRRVNSWSLMVLTHWGRDKIDAIFPDDIFKWIFLNENVWILIKISLKFVPKDPINNIPALVQITAWRRRGDKPLSEPMMVNLLTHICVTRPQWLKVAGSRWLNHWWQRFLIETISRLHFY